MNILIIKTSSLGDIIHAYPVVAFLKKKFPGCCIDWVVEEQGAELVRSHPDIENTFVVRTKHWRKNLFKTSTWQEIFATQFKIAKKRYDYIFDLQGNIKSGLIAWMARGQKIGFSLKDVPEWPNILFTHRRYSLSGNQNIREDYLSLVGQAVNEKTAITKPGLLRISKEQSDQNDQTLLNPIFKAKKVVMVCPGSAWKNKQMSFDGLHTFLKLLSEYLDCSYIFIWGNNEEKLLSEKLQEQFPKNSIVLDRLTLPALQNLMGKMDLVVAMDSLPLHLAGSSGSSTFSIFGSSSAKKYKPLGNEHLAYQGSCPFGKQFDKRCPILRTCPTGDCIQSLSGNEVFDSFKEQWSSLKKSENSESRIQNENE